MSDIQQAYKTGIPVGEGAYGVTKLVVLEPSRSHFILKYFGSRYDEAVKTYQTALRLGSASNKLLEYLEYKMHTELSRAKKEKKEEERKHSKVYNAIMKHAPRLIHHVCAPFKSDHPLISIQEAANQDGEQALPLNKFMALIEGRKISMERSNAEMKRNKKKTKKMNSKNVESFIGSRLLDIMRAFVRSGIVHADFKEDNIMAVYKINENYVVKDLKLKVIDFGLTEVNNSRALVTTNLASGTMDYSHLQKLHNTVSSRFKHDKNGIFSEAYWYSLGPTNTGERPAYMRALSNKYGMRHALRRQLQQTAQSAGAKISRELARSPSVTRIKERLSLPPSRRFLSQNDLRDLSKYYSKYHSRKYQMKPIPKFQNAMMRIMASRAFPQRTPAPPTPARGSMTIRWLQSQKPPAVSLARNDGNGSKSVRTRTTWTRPGSKTQQFSRTSPKGSSSASSASRSSASKSKGERILRVV